TSRTPSSYSFFSILIRPQPSTTLFPYTTLFRSKRVVKERLAMGQLLRIITRGFCVIAIPVFLLSVPVVAQNGSDDATEIKINAQDRKSTRLNSSHLGISYAVFCLKKKKKTQIII